MERVEDDYRLGNILDAWYGQEHVPSRKACSFNGMTCRNIGTFGKWLTTNPPISMVVHPCDLFLQNAAEWWWCYDYDNHVSTYPYFSDSLRAAIAAYFAPRPPVDATTCVVHYRVGDFLNAEAMVSLGSMVDAISEFERTPTRFEILNGGSKFRATPAIEQQSRNLLESLKTMLAAKYPNAMIELIESNNADADFYRMVTAPMLLTGPGSFAIMAAAANKNERLTPAIKNINFPVMGPIPAATIYEKWRTYAY